MNETLIDIQQVTLSYGERKIFSNLNVKIPKGKIIAILGPSGCGKTSFLRLISQLTYASEGSIYFHGTDLTQLSEAKMQNFRRKIGFMFQSNALFTDLNVYENIAYPIRVHSNLSEDLVRTITLMKLQMVL